MQVILTFVFALGLAGNSLGGEYSEQKPQSRVVAIDRTATTATLTAPNVDFCSTCIQFSQSALNSIINIILNAGVVGSCTKLCEALAEKTNSQILGVGCTLLCSYVGVSEFIKLVEKADLDPFYMCELLKVCPTLDNGDAELINATVSPSEGPQGTQFAIGITFATKNGTGIGETVIDIQTVDDIPIGDAEITPAQKPGTYEITWNVKAKPDPSCDPTQQICEQWLPGNYTADVSLCYGECGSKHPHSEIYFTGAVHFVLT